MSSTRLLDVAGRPVGHGARCFVIAEAGVNHEGCVDRALALVDAAAAAGADAVKFQTFKAAKLANKDAPKANYQKANTDAAESQFEMLERLELSHADHERIAARCRERDVLFMSTPFDEESADYLHGLGVAIFKIPSGEVTNGPFVEHVARLGIPMILSTGMCTIGEVEAAVDAITAAGGTDLVLLHCVSNYPADPADTNLRAMQTMRLAFDRPVGYSDHTLGIEVSLAAVALGACVIEKHFTLDRTLPGPDHAASLEPDELTTLIRSIRTVESALGTGVKKPAESERNTAEVARRSLVAAFDLPAGTTLDESHVTARRPGTGLPPSMRPHLLSRKLRRDVPAGTPLGLEMFE